MGMLSSKEQKIDSVVKKLDGQSTLYDFAARYKELCGEYEKKKNFISATNTEIYKLKQLVDVANEDVAKLERALESAKYYLLDAAKK